jgi:epoxyqueuosine reductase
MINNSWHQIKKHAKTIGFENISCSDIDLSLYIPHYNSWVDNKYNADMGFMTKHGLKRLYPEILIPDTQRVIVVTMNYLHNNYSFKTIKKTLIEKKNIGTVSEYALGRDYHKVIKKKLQELANFISNIYPEHKYRVFTDSAPVLEKPLAEKAGIGSIGKNGNLLNEKDGSFFFIGTLYTNIPFPIENKRPHDICGKCTSCIKICPTNAIVAPKVVDANKCISYLTIENKGAIPHKYRKAIGSRIYGCDDCQLICPINRNAPLTKEKDFAPRSELLNRELTDLFKWQEKDFLKITEGSAIRRIGYNSWRRNIAIALGNAHSSDKIISLLRSEFQLEKNDIVREAIEWALKNHQI